MEDCWANEWVASSNTLREFIEHPSNKPPGHYLHHLRLGWAKTASFWATIGATDLEWCVCDSVQTVHHINACPLFQGPSGPQGIKTPGSRNPRLVGDPAAIVIALAGCNQMIEGISPKMTRGLEKSTWMVPESNATNPDCGCTCNWLV